jgi:hypothetical protein
MPAAVSTTLLYAQKVRGPEAVAEAVGFGLIVMVMETDVSLQPDGAVTSTEYVFVAVAVYVDKTAPAITPELLNHLYVSPGEDVVLIVTVLGKHAVAPPAGDIVAVGAGRTVTVVDVPAVQPAALVTDTE